MTNELEKQFFDTFGVESQETRTKECERCAYYEVAYDAPCYVCMASKCPYVIRKQPQITDRILLELICILNNYGKSDTWAVSVENLKDCILMNCIKVIKEKDLKEMPLNKFKHQIHTLFKEG